MDRLKASALLAVVGLVLLPGILAAETFWEGSAARIREGEIAESGLLAASNTFPRNTRIRVTNRSSGTTETLTVVKRIDRVTSVMLLVSPEAAARLGIGAQEVVPVRIALAGDQGIPVNTGALETALSPDPDLNPSASAPVLPVRTPLIEPARAAETAQPVPEPTQTAMTVETPTTQTVPDGAPATMETAPAAVEPAATGSTEPAGAIAAAPSSQPAATESVPAATEPSEGPIELPDTTRAQDETFLAQLAERTPSKRVFAPARGADVAELILAEEPPSISLEPDLTGPETALAPEALLDRPDVSRAPAATQAATPFVQTERPELTGSTAPGAPEVAMLPGATSLIESAQPITEPERPLTVEPVEPEDAAAFVQTEQPRPVEVASNGTPLPPTVPESEAADAQRPFVQTEPPHIEPVQVAALTPAPTAPEGATPSPQAIPVEGPPFVQTEPPAAEPVEIATATPAPTPPGAPGTGSTPSTAEAGFVQTEQPIAADIAITLVPTSPQPPLASAPGSAFVQTEGPVAQATPLAVDTAGPAIPLERVIGAGMVQTEQPSPGETRIAVDTATPSVETARDVTSMVDFPAVATVGPPDTLPATPSEGPEVAGLPRMPRVAPLEGGALVATLGTAGRPAGTVPSSEQTTVTLTPTETQPPPTGTDTQGAVAATPDRPGPAGATPAALLSAAVARKGLPVNTYYLQVAAVTSERLAEDMASELASSYPSLVIPPVAADTTVFRVLVGPVTEDERGAVLYQLRAGGYRDAYIRYLN